MEEFSENSNVTVKEIAHIAGVSPGTVDRVIHNRPEVSEKTRDRVLGIIEELGYKPNLLARSLASKKIYKIAFIKPSHSKSNPYWSQCLEGVRKSVGGLEHFGFSLIYFEFDATNENSFREIAVRVLNYKPDGIILVPFFTRESNIFLDECDKEGIPYCFMDSRLKNRSYLSFVGQDGFQSGYASAKLMNYMVPDHSSVLVVNIATSFGNTNLLFQRVEGFKHFFETDHKRKNIRIIQREIPDSSDPRQIAFDTHIIDELDIKGIYIPNSRCYIVASLLEKHHLASLPVIGYDLIPQNIALLRKGYIDFLIGQRPQKQGDKVVLLLFDHLVLKKKVPRDNFSPIDIITSENLDQYLQNLEM